MNQLRDFLEYIFNAIKIWIIVQPWEQAIRVRRGKYTKLLSSGMFFRIPYIDSIYIQSTRLRVVSMPMQTLTSRDLSTVTINSALGYSINDIGLVYKTLYHPELTLANMAMSEIADFVYKHNIEDLNPDKIMDSVIDKLNASDYGIKVEYFRLTNFAVVKTFRLIQDQSWTMPGLELDQAKK